MQVQIPYVPIDSQMSCKSVLSWLCPYEKNVNSWVSFIIHIPKRAYKAALKDFEALRLSFNALHCPGPRIQSPL